MRIFTLANIKRGAVVTVAAASLLASSAAFTANLYSGQPKEQAGITLSGWGSGTAVESTERHFSGEKSIKIKTEGMHSGGCIEFNNPIELAVGNRQSNEYLQFVTNFVTMITLNPTGYTYGRTYGGYDYGSSSADVLQMPKVTRIRVVFVTEDGKSYEVQQPVVSSENDEGWPRINIPLAAIKVPEGVSSIKVKKIMIFTDIPDSLFIGEINTLTDSTKITCDAGDEQVVASNDVVLFRGMADGGASTLLYSWDFDDKDGIQENAGGPVVLHVYKKAGVYNVTLTVRDANGLKAPATSTVKIEVND